MKLIMKGADKNIKDSFGKTPFDLAHASPSFSSEKIVPDEYELSII